MTKVKKNKKEKKHQQTLGEAHLTDATLTFIHGIECFIQAMRHSTINDIERFGSNRPDKIDPNRLDECLKGLRDVAPLLKTDIFNFLTRK